MPRSGPSPEPLDDPSDLEPLVSKQQRFVFLAIAGIIAIVAAFALTSGDEDDAQNERASAPQSQTPTATPEGGADPVQTATPTPTPIPRRKIPMLRAGTEKKIKVKKGERVRFAARSATDEEVHVHGYDISKEAPANETVRLSFTADIEGVFEVEFERSAEPIARLTVEP